MNVFYQIRYEIEASIAIAKRYMRIYYARPGTIMFGLMFPLFMFLSFVIGRKVPINMLISSLTSMTLLFSSSSIGPMILPMERRLKTIERLLVAPISFYSILIGIIFCSMIYSISISTIPIIIGFFIVKIEIANLALLVVGILISAICFGSLGMMFASYPTEYPGNVTMALNFVRLPLLFISGIFIPIETLPEWQRTIAYLSPLTYSNDIIRYSLQGKTYFSPAIDILSLSLFTVIFLVTGVRINIKFSDVSHQRTGKKKNLSRKRNNE